MLNIKINRKLKFIYQTKTTHPNDHLLIQRAIQSDTLGW